jgi:NAD(P)-dependent dehydrogenase (short-subunit alcohol dehydrogenase family)
MFQRKLGIVLNQFDLVGRTALITGAGGLLGYEHAAALLECGCSVVLTDINEQSINSVKDSLDCEFQKGVTLSYFMDVTNLTSIEGVCELLCRESIHIDILINNAAIDPKVYGECGLMETSRLEYFSRSEWDKQISVGLTGAFLCSKVFGTRMAAIGNGGVILNIASDLSIIAPDQRLYRKDGLPSDLQPVKPVTYSVIKAGLIGLTRYLASYWADMGVRCNALSPGGVMNGQDEDFLKRLSNLIPIGRMAKKNEYRSAIQFLCSDASSYMTGQNVIIDGGRSVI